MSLDPIVAETRVPVTPTEAFVGFTAQMGEWWDPMLTPDPPRRASHTVEAPEPHSSTRAPGRSRSSPSTASAAVNVHHGTSSASMSSRS